MKGSYLMAVGVVLLTLAAGTYAGVVPSFSTASPLSCISVYGVDPIAIKGLGVAVGAQSFFQAQIASPTFSGYSNWQGPAPLPAGYLNPPATQGSQWAATPTGSPAAVLASNGFYTNPNGGPLASITWENTIYSLPPGTYYWSTITGYVGTTAPTYAQSGGSYGTAIVSVTSYYDLALYFSGGCYEGSTPPSTTISMTQATTSAQTQASTATTQGSSTVTSSVIGQQPQGQAFPLSFSLFAASGLVFLFVGAWMEKEDEP